MKIRMVDGYTLLSLGMAALFLFCSMAGIKAVWKHREAMFLSESGRADVEIPVRESLEWENKESAGKDVAEQGNFQLTAEQMNEALNAWNHREGDIIHEPVSGQILIGDAVESGKKWLVQTGLETEQTSAYSVNATLSVGKSKETDQIKLEPYYSFWTVQMVSQNLDASFLINAVTGQVWEAKIIVYESIPEGVGKNEAIAFWTLAGLPVTDGNLDQAYDKADQAVYEEEGIPLSAQVSYQRFRLDESTIAEYHGTDTVQKEYAVITYIFVSKK